MTDAAARQDNSDAHAGKNQSKIRKISRTDLSLLPRRFWHLANNSFLLHGYQNYNHLILVEEDDRNWLGVPGIYDLRKPGPPICSASRSFPDPSPRCLISLRKSAMTARTSVTGAGALVRANNDHTPLLPC